jgi:DNA-binding FadR family transcriptional regulator
VNDKIPQRPPGRRPRLTEEVAQRLRERIVTGEIEHGSLLPHHEELQRSLSVSMPTLREALRILEVEGLIQVKLGRGGGAIVNRPSASHAGYLLALVMQAQRVTLADVLRSLVDLEPVCAAGCARRADRNDTVVPSLEATIRRSLEVIDDATAYTQVARRFHHELIASCGVQTTVILVDALEAIWAAHVDRLVAGEDDLGPFALRSVRLETVDEHQTICELIREGDVDGTVAAMRLHYNMNAPDGIGRSLRIDLSTPIDAGYLRAT